MSLNGTYDHNNIFAQILRGDSPSVKIYEDDHTLAFMDVYPQTPGHCLVVPKTASRNFMDTPAEPLARTALITQKVSKAISEALSPDGIAIAQFNGAPAGQTVFHLHFHVIPRYNGQEVKPHASAPADGDELEEIAAKIRAAL